MKKIVAIIAFFITCNVLAQAPQVINYQAIARDAGGNIVTNNIGVKFRILQGSTSGISVYEETHTASPSSAGVFNVGIGAGSVVSGSFSGILWQNGPYFLEVSIDPAGGTSYTTIGTTQLLSVPYALYAEKAGNLNLNIGSGLSLTSGTLSNSAPNQTVSITSGSNIAVTGSYPSYTISSTGSSSTSVPNTSLTGTGIATVTAAGTNTFNVAVQTPSLVGVGSTTVSGSFPSYTISTPSAGVSGWSILGNAGTTDGTNFIGTTDNKPINFRINNIKAGRIDTVGRTHYGYKAGLSNTDVGSTAVGYQALMSNSTGTASAAFGFNSLRNNTTGLENAAFGYNSLSANTAGNYNSALGAFSLLNNTASDNTAVGNWTMRNNTVGNSNTAVGSLAMMSSSTGSYNSAVGYSALSSNGGGLFQNAFGYNALKNNSAGFNIGIGAEALMGSTTGTANIGIGNATFSMNVNGINNTGVGFAAGQFNSGSGNVFLGYKAGQNETGSNKLIIANTPSTNLIYGDFASERVGLGTTILSYKLHVVETNSNAAIGAINNYSATAVGSAHGIFASASNPSNSSAAVYATHSGGGNGVSGISTSVTFAGTAGVYGLTLGTGTTNIGVQADATAGNSIGMFAHSFNTHTGMAFLARKDGSAGSGVVAKVENQLATNSADALFVTTNGIGASIHAVNGPTVAGSSNVTILSENGHLHTVQSVKPAIAMGIALGGGSSSINGTGTDTAGEILFNTGSPISGTSPFELVRVTFNKTYNTPPVVILTPRNSTAGNLNVWVAPTATGFSIMCNTVPPTFSNHQYFYFVIGK